MSLRDIGVYAPLAADHPAVGDTCWLCGNTIYEGQRTALLPKEPPGERPKTVECFIIHANCYLKGKTIETTQGLHIVERVKDGDASPYSVDTVDGKQWKDDEVLGLW